jgi:signal transduction histidine kinase
VAPAAELDSTRPLPLQALFDEQHRLARDVHDIVGHTLATVMLHVTGARHVLRHDPDAAEQALRSAEALGRRSMEELRRTFALLRSRDEPGVVPSLPSAAEIGALVEEARAGGLPVELRTRGDLARIPPAVGVALYRIAQEALANAARHAPAARTVLGLQRLGGQVFLEAKTSGPVLAATPDHGRPHYGLLGMRERATALGGELTAGPSQNGWRVTCRLPLRTAEKGLQADGPAR